MSAILTRTGPLAIAPWPADAAPLRPYRTGSIAHTGEGDITARLGFCPLRDSVVGKTDQEWWFTVDNRPCAIWDMKGSGRLGMWSTFGPAEVFAALFGWRAGP